MLGSAESQVPKLISRENIFAECQRVWSQSTITHGRTNGQTDGQTTYHGNTALRYASRGKKYKKLNYCWENVRRESMPRIAEMDVEMTT